MELNAANIIEYCNCEEIKEVYGESDSFGNEWLICSKCNKPIEDTFEPAEAKIVHF